MLDPDLEITGEGGGGVGGLPPKIFTPFRPQSGLHSKCSWFPISRVLLKLLLLSKEV